MTGFFINRPIFATAVAIIMLLAGAISILALPIAQFPNIAPGTVNVTAGIHRAQVLQSLSDF